MPDGPSRPTIKVQMTKLKRPTAVGRRTLEWHRDAPRARLHGRRGLDIERQPGFSGADEVRVYPRDTVRPARRPARLQHRSTQARAARPLHRMRRHCARKTYPSWSTTQGSLSCPGSPSPTWAHTSSPSWRRDGGNCSRCGQKQRLSIARGLLRDTVDRTF